MTIEKAKYHAMKYLTYRSRTTHEVRTYLQQKEYSEQIISEVIDFLKIQSYLDDDNFCQLWIEERLRLKPKGRKGLFFELKNKGIDNSIIEQNINANYTPELELEIAQKLALQKYQQFNNNTYHIKEKISAYLYRR
ncbi:MAG: regulatory protein RecX, partial [Peptococcales bacterium]